MKLFLDNGDQHVGGHVAPDLRFHCVLAGAEKSLNAQVLLDPLEEQLDLPAAFVQSRDRQRWQDRVVGQEDERLARLGIRWESSKVILTLTFMLGTIPSISSTPWACAHRLSERENSAQIVAASVTCQ